MYRNNMRPGMQLLGATDEQQKSYDKLCLIDLMGESHNLKCLDSVRQARKKIESFGSISPTNEIINQIFKIRDIDRDLENLYKYQNDCLVNDNKKYITSLFDIWKKEGILGNAHWLNEKGDTLVMDKETMEAYVKTIEDLNDPNQILDLNNLLKELGDKYPRHEISDILRVKLREKYEKIIKKSKDEIDHIKSDGKAIRQNIESHHDTIPESTFNEMLNKYQNKFHSVLQPFMTKKLSIYQMERLQKAIDSHIEKISKSIEEINHIIYSESIM